MVGSGFKPKGRTYGVWNNWPRTWILEPRMCWASPMPQRGFWKVYSKIKRQGGQQIQEGVPGVGVHGNGLGSFGMDWGQLEWIGVNWNGLGSNGMDWVSIGMGWGPMWKLWTKNEPQSNKKSLFAHVFDMFWKIFSISTKNIINIRSNLDGLGSLGMDRGSMAVLCLVFGPLQF